jgi:hypothetical protein
VSQIPRISCGYENKIIAGCRNQIALRFLDITFTRRAAQISQSSTYFIVSLNLLEVFWLGKENY